MKKTFGTLVLIALISQLFLWTYPSVAAQDAPLDISTAELADSSVYRVTPRGPLAHPVVATGLQHASCKLPWPLPAWMLRSGLQPVPTSLERTAPPHSS